MPHTLTPAFANEKNDVRTRTATVLRTAHSDARDAYGARLRVAFQEDTAFAMYVVKFIEAAMDNAPEDRSPKIYAIKRVKEHFGGDLVSLYTAKALVDASVEYLD